MLTLSLSYQSQDTDSANQQKSLSGQHPISC